MGRHASRDVPFLELCCGGAAVSLELISRGKPPELITLVDAGPWGLFWKAIGEGWFDISLFHAFLEDIPNDTSEVPDWMGDRAREPCSPCDVPYLFPLLQSASFGGVPVGYDAASSAWVKKGTWAMEGSNVNYKTLLPVVARRIERLAVHMRGVSVTCGAVEDVCVDAGAVAYFDPPYKGTAGYAHSTDTFSIISRTCAPVYVSERVPLNPGARKIVSRARSGLNSLNERDDSEYLSLFNSGWTTPEPVADQVEQTSLFD